MINEWVLELSSLLQRNETNEQRKRQQESNIVNTNLTNSTRIVFFILTLLPTGKAPARPFPPLHQQTLKTPTKEKNRKHKQTSKT